MSVQARPPRVLAYGVGSIGTGIFTTVPSVLLLYFLSTVARIDVAVAGLIILIPKALGLVGDPLVGIWADRLGRKTQGGRLVLMAAGALLAGTGLCSLFAVPQLHPGNVLVPTLIYLACTVGYSLFAVPYSALPAELDARPDGRRRLVSTRLGISFLGTLIGGVGAPLVAARVGYAGMGAVVGVSCAVAMGLFLLFCPLPSGNRVHVVDKEGDFEAGAARIAMTPFIIQMFAFVLLLASTGTFAALLPFLVRDMKASADVVGFAMLVVILSALLTSTIWPSLIRRLGLRAAWRLAAGATALSSLVVGTAAIPNGQFYLGMAIGGAGLSGVQIAGFTGLADLTARYLAKGHGAGFITGVWMAGEKAGLATGPLLAGLGLKFLGTAMLGSAARSSTALIPAVLAAIAIIVIGCDPTGNRNNQKLNGATT